MDKFVQLVTPDLARSWLDHNKENRPIRQAFVERWARTMRAGKWRLTHEGIAFDTEGRLIDGQHRLLALVLAGVSVQFTVFRNVDPEARIVIGTGATRSAFDVSVITGLTASEKAIQIMRYHFMAKHHVSATAEELLTLVKTHEAPLAFVVAQLGQTRRVQSAAVLLPIVRAWYTRERPRLGEFLRLLETGVMQEPGDQAAIVLRNLLVQGMNYGEGQRRRMEQSERYWKTERALDMFLKRETTTRLYRANQELFPFPDDTESTP